MSNGRTVKAAGLSCMPISLLSRAASSASELLIEPRDLGFQITRKRFDDDEGTVAIVVSTVTEKAADGTTVGSNQSPPHHEAVFSNLDISRRNDTESRRDDIPATAVSVSTSIPGRNTTISLSACTYLESGESTTLDPSTVMEVNNRTVRLDLEVAHWRFCTPFGRGGGVACLAEDQHTFLELPWAPSNPAAPPPPHTLLIPRCHEDTIATLWFICDPRLPLCADVVFVKFYLGEARWPPNQAPNVATIEDASVANATDALGEGAKIGVYAHNVTRSELVSYLNVTDLSLGVEYTFWTVWGHGNGSVPESNTQDIDLERTQYWQCPGTLIERNFEVGASLHVKFSVNASRPLLALCGPNSAENHLASSQGRLGKGASGKGAQYATGRGLHGEQRVSCVPGDGSLPVGGQRQGGARIYAGNLSAIQFSSGAELDGTWTPLVGGSSAADTPGDFVATIGTFNRTAVYSIALFFASDEQLSRSEKGGTGTKIPMWAVLGSSAFLSLCMGCCIMRLAKRVHAAKPLSTASIPSKRRSRGAAAKRTSGALGDASASINLGSGDGKELQIFPMPTPGATIDPLSPSSSSNSAAFDGWTASEPIGVPSSRVRRLLRDGSQTNDPTPVSDCPSSSAIEASFTELQLRLPEANETRRREGT